MTHAKELKINLDAENDTGQNAFEIAWSKESSNMVEIILQQCISHQINMNLNSKFNETPFHLAVRWENKYIVKLLMIHSGELTMIRNSKYELHYPFDIRIIFEYFKRHYPTSFATTARVVNQ